MTNKINYQEYKNELNKILKEPKLISLGIKKYTLAKTTYNYDLDYLTIGFGKKDIF